MRIHILCIAASNLAGQQAKLELAISDRVEAIKLIERSLVKTIATRVHRQTLDLELITPTTQVGPGQLGP